PQADRHSRDREPRAVREGRSRAVRGRLAPRRAGLVRTEPLRRAWPGARRTKGRPVPAFPFLLSTGAACRLPSFELEKAEPLPCAVGKPEAVYEPIRRLPVAARAQADGPRGGARNLKLRDLAVRRDAAEAIALAVPHV